MKEITANPKYFRKGTQLPKYVCNFIIPPAGLGDLINWMPAFQWIANENPHVYGRIFLKEPFRAVAQYIFRNTPNWKVFDLKLAEKQEFENPSWVRQPKPSEEAANATNMHLLDLGFITFAQTETKKEYNFLPVIDYNGKWKWPELDPKKPYAVFTPGATTPSRTVPARYFNELVAYTIEKGVTPVFLGKRDFCIDPALKGYKASIDDGYLFDGGIDLTEKTTLLETVQIMRSAKFVLGLDNGLLHFAGTTEVPIIFGYNITTPQARKIRRRKGYTIDIEVPSEILSCIGCQNNMRFINGHRFRNCIYTDVACMDYLFSNNCESWKKAIDFVLEREVYGESSTVKL